MVDHSNPLRMGVDGVVGMAADVGMAVDVGIAVDRNPNMADRCMMAMSMDLKCIQICV